MMISPEGFISQHRKKSYEELLALRDDLFADIQRFEHKEISEDEWMIVKERIEADLFRRGTLWQDRAFLT